MKCLTTGIFFFLSDLFPWRSCDAQIPSMKGDMIYKDSTVSVMQTSGSQIPAQQYGQRVTGDTFGNTQYYGNTENYQICSTSGFEIEQTSCHDVPDLSSGYWCPNCFKQYSTKYTLLRHIKFECGKEPQFPCSQCFKRFKHKSHLVRHMRVCKVCLVNK